MKAWRVYDTNDMRLEEVPLPEPQPGWALTRVKVFQPSITEVQRFWGTTQRGVDKMRQKIREIGPFPLGHEVCAEVVAVADDPRLQVGDRVAYFHWEGHVAGTDYPGCFAEYVLLPTPAIARIHPAIPDLEGPALQPLSSCIHNVQEASIKFHETVAVFGQGVMGLNVTQLCHLAGARQVIGVDVREQCLGVARELGADVTINASQQDPVAAIMELTGGQGADVAFECASGSPEVGLSGGKTLPQAIACLRPSGRLVQIAFYHEPVTLDLNVLRAKRIKYIFPNEATMEDMELGIQLVASGRVRLKPYITHVLHGIEKLPQAFDITAHKARHNAINPPVVVVSP